jgi:ribosomal protein S18 acetylase RimI-like enzyme
MIIKPLGQSEQPPWDLLLLADPSKELVSVYLSNSFCYVAEKYGSVIGIIVLQERDSGTAEIMNLAVHPNMQGRGIGQALIKQGIEAAREKGFNKIEIGTGNSSIGQLALYQKTGFRITGIDHDFFTRNYDEPIFENGIQCRDMIRLSMII